MSRFAEYIAAGDEIIRQHPDFGRIHDHPSDDYETCATDQIAQILHAVCDVDGATSSAQSILDRALRTYEGDQEERGEDDPPVVVVVRDPDASNDYTVFAENGPTPETVDVDLGYADLRDLEEFRDWAESHRERAKRFIDSGTPNRVAAGKYLLSLVAEMAGNFDHDEEATA